MPRSRYALASLLLLAPTLAHAQLNEYGNPKKLAPASTSPAITVRDLQIRLYQFADDSMHGRQVGRVGNKKGTDYIAAELRRLGLQPAGDDGTYFQVLPYHVRKYTSHSRLTVNGTPLQWNEDFVAVPGLRQPRAVTGVEVVFGGTAGDTTTLIPAAQAAGKLVVLLPARAPQGGPPATTGRGQFGANAATANRFADAAAVATVDLDGVSMAQRVAINEPTVATSNVLARRLPPGSGPTDSLAILRQQVATLAPPATLRLTRAAAAKLFRGRPVEGLEAGARGGTATASLDYVELPSDWARNVVAILPGSDPALRHEYVAIGAHNDHVGFATPVDKDSLKAFNAARNRLLMANGMISLRPEQLASIRVNMDSIRRVHPKARLDSINNGADDDGSGSMGVLEIAEALAKAPTKPKRSILFVWHTGEEAGLLGSRFFTQNPTVPMDSIVAQLNIDMIGRGRAEDIPGGGPDYLGVVGSFFDSKDLGETVAAVNRKQGRPLQLDYRYDSTMTWSGYNNIYGRSDHYNYALQGVPIAFFFTGLHGDYHQRSDEAEYIDYPHYQRIASYIRDVTVEVANGPRPRINGSRPAKPPTVVP